MLFSTGVVLAQTRPPIKEIAKLIDDNLHFAAQQYKMLMQKTLPDRMPRTYKPKEDKSVTTSSFLDRTLYRVDFV
ncbi:MAG: hypothetical protein ICV65_07770 [Flavisolibacter sp.]|nr:hypothetical protein [Flavisolibacter sp.]